MTESDDNVNRVCPLCDEGILRVKEYSDVFSDLKGGIVEVHGLSMSVCSVCGGSPIMTDQVMILGAETHQVTIVAHLAIVAALQATIVGHLVMTAVHLVVGHLTNGYFL